MGNMHPESARGNGGHHIGLERVSDHQRTRRPIPVAGENALIGLRGLLADDLDRVEIFAQPRLRQFALLVEEVALGDEDDAVAPGQRVQRLARVGKCFHRIGQHLAAEAEDLRDHRGGDFALRHLHRRLDHREGEALDAIAIETEVAALRLQQAGGEHVMLAMAREQLGEALLRHPEEGLVLPQRVIGIEADGADGRSAAMLRPRARRARSTGVPTITLS